MKFSIVIPFYNDFGFLEDLSTQINNLSFDHQQFEVVFVNSGSDYSISDRLKISSEINVKLIEISKNEGPGVARNFGIRASEGEYILFLDADDYLSLDSLQILDDYIYKQNNNPDLISFDYSIVNSLQKNDLPRFDSRYLREKCVALEHFALHQMDGSVIFSAFKRIFLLDNELQFDRGFYEDIYFLFSAYQRATKIEYVDRKIYYKTLNPLSITSKTSKEHFEHYLEAYRKILNYAQNNACTNCGTYHNDGLMRGAAVALTSRYRQIVSKSESKYHAEELLEKLEIFRLSDPFYSKVSFDSLPKGTNYYLILREILSKNVDFGALYEFISSLEGSSLSCKDLHHSIFLAPDEIRTCCKRFFVNGEMRGDVALNVTIDSQQKIGLLDIQNAKSELWRDINLGNSTGCDFCPYLERGNWESFGHTLQIKTLSMEQHSVCNLRCTYCDPIFYGGKRTEYDVTHLLLDMQRHRVLEECSLVVWGGGEPTLDPNFKNFVDLVDQLAPRAHHRFLSNSLRYSETIHEMIASRNAQLVTSIDAGSDQRYLEIRGRGGFSKVLNVLEKYARDSSKRITVKYIFTQNNCKKNDVDEFCDAILGAGLSNCYFQISGDFKEEYLNEEMLNAALYLYTKLSDLKVFYVYLDEHIWTRWENLKATSINDLPTRLLDVNLMSYIENPNSNHGFYIWGAGQLSTMLLKGKGFSKRWNILGVVDSTPERIGKKYFEFTIESPEILKSNDGKVFLSAIQSIVQMRGEFDALRLSDSRLLKGMLW